MSVICYRGFRSGFATDPQLGILVDVQALLGSSDLRSTEYMAPIGTHVLHF